MSTAVSRPSLNHYLTENLGKNISQLECKSCLYNALEKISWVALIAIMGTVLAISYSGTILTETVSLIVVGMALSTILFSSSIAKFKIWSDQYAKQAKTESHVQDHFKKIAGWKTDQIQKFLEEQKVDLDRIPIDALKQIKPEYESEPLRALLPLIARFNYLRESAQALAKTAKEALACKIEQDIKEKETELGKPIEESVKRTIRLENRETAYQQYEFEALPKVFDAAVILQIMEQPTRELSVLDVGAYRAKNYEERKFDQEYAPTDNDYFVLSNGRSLSLSEVEQNMEPSALRLKLFPKKGS